jgi:diguanylate cyclase (GGDEF)-like protein/PAS domain S-box-containing protein
MNLTLQTLPLAYALAGLMAAATALFAVRRQDPGMNALTIMLLFYALWAWSQMVGLWTPNPVEREFWRLARFTGAAGAALGFLFFAHRDFIRQGTRDHLVTGFWFLVPVLFLASIWTPALRPFIGPPVGLGLAPSPYAIGPVLLAWFVFVFVVLVLSVSGGLVSAWRRPRLYRFRVDLDGFSATALGLGHLWLALEHQAHPGLDPTPYAFIATFTGLMAGLGRRERTAFLPLSRGAVLENMAAGALVLDEGNRVMDWNLAGRRLLGLASEEVLGVSLAVLFSKYPSLLVRLERREGFEEEITWGQSEASRFWVLRLIPLQEPGGRDLGRLVLIEDITGRKKENLARREASLTDPLTGLIREEHFQRHLGVEVERARRYGHALSLLLVDVDHLGALNATFGPETGDVVLKGVADALLAGLRAVDFVGRLSPAILAAALPATGPDGAMIVAQRLLAAVGRTVFPSRRGRVGVTVSIGLASVNGHAPDLEHLLSKARESLIRAKKAGRNRVRAFDEEDA